MNYQNLIVASPEINLTLTYGSNVVKIDTGVQLTFNASQDVQEIFAIGQKPPIGVISLNQRFTGKITFQSGEYEIVLDAINATLPAGQFIASMLDLNGFSLGWTINMGGITPRTIIYSLDFCRINSIDYSADRNSPETNNVLAMQGTGITRTVRNI